MVWLGGGMLTILAFPEVSVRVVSSLCLGGAASALERVEAMGLTRVVVLVGVGLSILGVVLTQLGY